MDLWNIGILLHTTLSHKPEDLENLNSNFLYDTCVHDVPLHYEYFT